MSREVSTNYNVVSGVFVEIIDGLICVERSGTGTTIRVGSVLLGQKPEFEMLDEAWLDALPAAEDALIYDKEIDERFFIKRSSTQLYQLDKTIKEKIAALPPGTSIRSDGSIIAIELVGEVSEAALGDALDIAKAFVRQEEDKLSFFAALPGAEPQPRPSWSECPAPQVLIEDRGVRIEVFVRWFSPMTLRALNRNQLPAGILSGENGRFIAHDEQAKPLLQEAQRVGAQELAPALGGTFSVYSSMGDPYLSVNLYSPQMTREMVLAAAELLTRLALIQAPVKEELSVVSGWRGDVINEVILLQQTDERALIHVGPVCVGEGPIFEMRDQTFLDTIKKLFFVKDHRVHWNRGVDKRFFITDYPSILSNVERTKRDEMYERMLALPAGAVLRMDGQILAIHLPPRVAEDVINNALQIAAILCTLYAEKRSIIERTPGVQRQPRASWERCPDPQYLMRCSSVMIELYVDWGGCVWLRTANVNAAPKGRLSVVDGRFCADGPEDAPLLREVERVNGQELAPALGKITSLYCSTGDPRLRIFLIGDLTQERIEAASDVLVRLAMPRSDGPFR